MKKSLLAALALTVLGIATQARAFTDYCYVWGIPPIYSPTCDCGPVPANSKGHFIYWQVGPSATYWLRDDGPSNTGAIIRYGKTGLTGASGTVFGLYSNYKLSVKALTSWGYLSNE